MPENMRNAATNNAICFGSVGAGHSTWLTDAAYDGDTVAAIDKYLLELGVPDDGTNFQT